MDFSFIYDPNFHPIKRLLGNSGSSKSKVKGMAHNAQMFVSSQKVPCYNKFAASLYTYLILQGYDNQELSLLTISPEQAEIFQYLPNSYKISKDVTPFYNLDPGKTLEVCIILLGNDNDPIESNVAELLSTFLDRVTGQVRSGLYLIGNPLYLSTFPKFRTFLACLIKHNRLSSSILLQCPRHKVEEDVREYKDFPILGGGFCSETCGQQLKCGHMCSRLCHFGDHENDLTKFRHCFRSCGKLCENNHPCTELCHSECQPCNAVMVKTFSCGHKTSYKCSEPLPTTCGKTKRIIRGPCGHELIILCGLDEAPKCHEIVTQKLPCGHTRRLACYRKSDPCDYEVSVPRNGCNHTLKRYCHGSLKENLDQPCEEECGRFCKRGHPCRSGHQCGEACPPCETMVSFLFECHHRLTIPCYEGDCREAQYCRESCSRPRSCDHPCNLACGKHGLQKCPPCKIIVNTERSCGHNWTHPCWVDESQVPCEELVNVQNMSSCGHRIELKCFQAAQLVGKEAVFFCESRCNYYFDPSQDGCGHFCTGICKECADNSGKYF